MYWRVRILALIALGIGAVAISSLISPAALAASALDLGVKAYNAGHYKAAISYINQAAAQTPRNARIHYYRANTLAKLGRHPEALREYRISYSLDPYGDCASYCRAALRAYGDPVAHAPLLGVGSHSALATITSAVGVDQALARVDTQARSASRKLLQSAQAEADFQQGLGEIQAQRIRDRAADEIASIRPTVLIGHKLHHVPGQLPGGHYRYLPFVQGAGFTPSQLAQMELIKERSAIDQVSARRTAQIQAARNARIISEKARLLEDTAANLGSQMTRTSLPDSVTLKPTGTNLYVRNYGG